jgi:HD superfamily phosphohydrolase
LCLTGGANINRYEHAIGTFFLAQECLKARPPLNPVSEKEQKLLMWAALLHDAASCAFGHSVEYIESEHGFDHEKAFAYVALGERGESYTYKLSTLEPVFFGLPRELLKKISREDLQLVGKIIDGKTRLGPLINSLMDLDNIDNVFRLGYHVGIVKSGEIPLRLAKSLYLENDELVLKKEAVPLVEEWYRVRKNLYSLLLLNPDEFSGKCMLTEAIEVSKLRKTHPFNWYDVDFELLKKLLDMSSDSAEIVSRLMKGDLYGCAGIFSTTKTDKYSIFCNIEEKKGLEEGLSRILRMKFKPALKSAMIIMHPIIDVNKTQRQVTLRTDDGELVQVGRATNRLLIAVFFKNVDLSIHKMSLLSEDFLGQIRQAIREYLSGCLADPDMVELKLYGELKELD